MINSDHLIFVMDTDGKLFAAERSPEDKTEPTVIHHNDYFPGTSVAMAGEMRITNGELEYVSNRSQDYISRKKHLQQSESRIVDILKLISV